MRMSLGAYFGTLAIIGGLCLAVTVVSLTSKGVSTASSYVVDNKTTMVREAASINVNNNQFSGVVNGKVIVYDNVKKDFYEKDSIASSLQWSMGDKANSYVLTIDDWRQRGVGKGDYSGVDVTFYKQVAVVHVYDIKNKKCLGRDVIYGQTPDHPNKLRIPKGARTYSVYGEIDNSIGRWIGNHFRG